MNRKYEEYSGFQGIVNSGMDTLSFPKNALKEGVNVDIRKGGMCSRRKGTTQVVAGSFHSMYSSDGLTCLVVQGGDLKRFHDDETLETLRSEVGDSPMSYDHENGVIYYTNPKAIGFVKDGTSHEFGQPDSTMAKEPPLPGDGLFIYNTRLYVWIGPYLYFSDPGYFGRFDMAKNFILMERPITMGRPVQDGIFLCAGATYFLAGGDPGEFMRVKLADYDAIPGTGVSIEANRIVLGNETFSGKAVAWMSEKGPCLGFNGGTFRNVGIRKYLMPSASAGASLYREYNDGLVQLVTVNRN